MIKGSTHDPATIEKMRQAHRGKSHTDATRRLISKVNTGRKMDPMVIAKVLLARAANKLKKEHDSNPVSDDKHEGNILPE